jgi:amidohydrolase
MSEAAGDLKHQACALVEEQRGRLLNLSTRIHSCPELKFEERQAAEWLAEYLAGAGFEVERGTFGLPTSFVAQAGSGRPCVALLCEYDALPELGHACGHNIIAAAGAGAGAAVAGVVSRTGGSVVVLGTPGEENGGGKIHMARRGAFDGIDAALMIHPAGAELPALRSLAMSQVEVVYRGRAAHAAAAPDRGVNALDALVTAYNAIARLRQHIQADERVHGIITDGGQVPNIVPERASGKFCVRALTEEQLAALKKRVQACFEAGALATGAELEIHPSGEDYSDLVSNQPLLDAYAENLARLGRRLADPAEAPSISGSTDMGNVSKLVPAIHPMIAVSPPSVALHSAEFADWAASEAGKRAVIDGAMALAMTAVDVLSNPDLLRAVKAAFAADTGKIEVLEDEKLLGIV